MSEYNEQIENIKKEINGLLIKADFMKDVITSAKEYYNTNKDELIKKRTNNIKQELEKAIARNLDKETIDLLTQISKKRYWTKYYNTIIDLCNNSLVAIKIDTNENGNIELNKDTTKYFNLVNYLTDNTSNETKKELQEDLIKTYSDLINVYASNFLGILIVRYLQAIKKYDQEMCIKIAYLLDTKKDNLSEELLKEYNEKLDSLNEEQASTLKALQDIKSNGNELVKLTDIELEKEEYSGTKKGKKNKNKQYEQIELPIFYRTEHNDIVSIIQSDLTENLVSNGFIIDLESKEKSEDIISNIKAIDREVLDYIIDIYKSGKLVFTDRDIAVEKFKESSSETISPKLLERINNSIERLQDTKLYEGLIADTNKGKIKFTRNSRLLWLDVMKIEKSDYVQHRYTIVAQPFYYDYTERTKAIEQHYPRALLTSKIDGVKHDFKTQTLIMYLVRIVLRLEYEDKIQIDLKNIYQILEIKDARKYTETRAKLENILNNSIKNNYNFEYSYVFKGRTPKQIVFRKINGLKLEKEQEM